MSQRISGYERKERDLYETPHWVTLALAPHLPFTKGCVWEPAAASGKMVAALRRIGFFVLASDIEDGTDFLIQPADPMAHAIITNPPYELATEFINHALAIIPAKGFVAMLLRCDFDHAKTRSYLFGDNKAFAKKVVLTKRIKWFEDSTGQPSFNHAWFIWDRQHKGPPVLAYGPANSKGE